MNNFEKEVSRGGRFEFNSNWTRFLNVLDKKRIKLAEQSLAYLERIFLMQEVTRVCLVLQLGGWGQKYNRLIMNQNNLRWSS